MSRPSLYRYPNENNLFSAHSFSERNNVSIRKARKIIAKKLESNEIECYYKQKSSNKKEEDERTITI